MDFHQIFDFCACVHPIWPPTTPTMFYSGAPLIVWPGPVQAIYFVYLALGLPHSVRLSTFPTFFIKISSTFRFFAHTRTCFWSSPPTRGRHHPPSLIGHTFHPFLIDCPSISTHYSVCSGLAPTPISMSGLRALTCSSIHPPPIRLSAHQPLFCTSGSGTLPIRPSDTFRLSGPGAHPCPSTCLVQICLGSVPSSVHLHVHLPVCLGSVSTPSVVTTGCFSCLLKTVYIFFFWTLLLPISPAFKASA